MAAATCMKRLARERERIPSDSPEFFVCWKEENLRQFEAYIVGPDDSLYKHKLIKLKFDVPEQYPLVPPKVHFVQHQGERIHPNLYVEGKVCLSILGTWAGDPWSYSMTIESVLITIRSLLDNQPYLHEPHQRDNPDFNRYVRYNTWRWLLLDYVARERDPESKAFLVRHINKYGAEMIEELEQQKYLYGHSRELVNPYARRTRCVADYDQLLADLKQCVAANISAEANEAGPQSKLLPPVQPVETMQSKRKAAQEPEDNPSPTKKPAQDMDVIDLTGDD